MITLTLVPPAWLDLMVVSLIGLAFGLALAIAQLMHRIDKTKDELSSATSKIETLNESHKEEITNIQGLLMGQIKELAEVNLKLKEQLFEKTKFHHRLNLLWLKDDQIPFCPHCTEVLGKPTHMIQKKRFHEGAMRPFYMCRNCNHPSPFYFNPFMAAENEQP